MRRRIGVLLALCLAAVRTFAALNGSVMTFDGQPIAGARVSVYASESSDARRARLLSANPEAVPLVSVQTDAKGAFSLESPKEPVVTLWVYARGYEPVSRRVERDEETGAIALSKAETRTGTITANGKPLANATVVLQYQGAEFLARTNEQGRYEAPDPKNVRSIVVVHPDVARDEETFVGSGSGTPASELNRTLSKGSTIAGRVVGTNGETPVAGATISVDGWPLATSGEDGSFTIARAPAKWSMLTARKDNLIVQRAAAKEASYTLRLGKGATISGRVTDAKNKVPVTGAMVRVGPRRFAGGGLTDTSITLLTDAKGAYSVVVPAGTYMLTANHPAHDARPVDVAVTAGQQVAKDVTLAPLARVSGVVLDEEKRPVAAAMISAPQVESMMMGPMRFRGGDAAVTGPDGRFCTRVQPDVELTIRALKRGMPQVKSDPMRLTSGERKTGLVLTIPTGIAVSGRVTDAQGNALSGATITAAEVENTGVRMRMTTILGGPSNDEEAVRTASDGTFTMRVKEGTYDFTIRREGYAPKLVRGHAVTLASTRPVEASLEPAVEITGRVTRGGTGLENVRIFALSPSGEASAVTGPDGSFTLTGLAAGQTRLMIRKEDDFVQDSRNVTAPARDVAIEIPLGGRVTGRVVEKGSNKAITTFQAGITVSRSGGGMMTMGPPQLRDFTSEDGSFVLENVPAGAMVLVANSPGYAAGRMNVTIEEGKTLSDVELQLDTGVKLTGRVTGGNGSPVADVTVRLMPSTTGGFSMSGMDRSTSTDSNGEYTLEALEAGEETVAFSHAKHAAAMRKTVTLKGRETRLDVQLASGQVVKGTVVTEGGAPVADASIDIVSSSGSFSNARTNASGAFEVEGLTPGRYRFAASKSGYAVGVVEDVDISSGAPVRITLRTGGTIYGRVTGLTAAELESTQVEARSGRNSASAVVDASGNYRLEGAPIGTVQVSAQVLSRNRSGYKASSAQTVDVTAGSSQQVDIAFRGDIVIRGRVTRNGTPLANAAVTFMGKGTSQRAMASGATDEQGMYSVDAVEEGEYTVMVNDQRYSPHTTSYTVRGSDTFNIDYKTAAVRGRVIDVATNEPLANVEVQVRTAALENMRIPRTVITDHTGSFVLDSVSPGNYTLTTSKDSYGNDVRDVTVSESGIDNLEIRLAKNTGIALKVVDARDGRPLSATVFVYDGSGRLMHETRFSFGGSSDDPELRVPVAPGSYTISVSAMGYAPQNVQAQSPSATRTVALTPGGQLHISSKHSVRRRYRIHDASGLPYNRISSIPPARDLLPSPGTTILQNVAPGTYTLYLLGDNDSVVDTQQVTVAEGQTTRVDL
jgi:protocatechuate 3,4-dioxygenase beta subunit